MKQMQEKIERVPISSTVHIARIRALPCAPCTYPRTPLRASGISLPARVNNDEPGSFGLVMGQRLANSPAFGALLALCHCLLASSWKQFASIFRRGRHSDSTTVTLANSPEQVNLQQKQQSNRCCQRSPYVPSANSHCESVLFLLLPPLFLHQYSAKNFRQETRRLVRSILCAGETTGQGRERTHKEDFKDKTSSETKSLQEEQLNELSSLLGPPDPFQGL